MPDLDAQLEAYRPTPQEAAAIYRHLSKNLRTILADEQNAVAQLEQWLSSAGS